METQRKILKWIGIIAIIVGIAGVGFAILGFAGYMIAASELSSQGYVTESGLKAEQVMLTMMMLLVLTIVSSVISVVQGVLCLKILNDISKAGKLLVVTFISVIVTVVVIVMSIAQHSFPLSSFVNLVVDGFIITTVFKLRVQSLTGADDDDEDDGDEDESSEEEEEEEEE